MIRLQLVEDCLHAARSMRPDGPWCFVIVDRDYIVLEDRVFHAVDMNGARRWLLERVQRVDRAPAFKLSAGDDPRRAP